VPKEGFVFCCDMGDFACADFRDMVPVLNAIDHSPATFLLLTKNPKRLRFLAETKYLPSNVVAAATVETDLDFVAKAVSRAPPPTTRLKEMWLLDWPRKAIAVEPVLSFSDPARFAKLIADCVEGTKEHVVWVGYDNYNNRLPEPPLDHVEALVRELKDRGVNVSTKTLRKAWWEGDG